MSKKTKLLEPIHPGEILLEEFMRPMEISINRISRDIAVPANRISDIVNGKRAITVDTALARSKCGRYRRDNCCSFLAVLYYEAFFKDLVRR